MSLTLYAVPASHPCAAAQAALELKGLDFRRVDLPQGLHFALQKLRFGTRTVPGLEGDGVRVVGSGAIMRVLDGLAPDPPLFPREAAERARVEEAERWGDEVLQPAVRRLAWVLIPRADSAAATSYLEGARLPVPPAVLARALPAVVPLERLANQVADETVAREVRALPGWLDRVDGWVADGTLGGERPNAAALQALSSVALLATFGDFAAMLEGRPAQAEARRVFPRFPGHVPAGTLPASLAP